MHEAHLLATLYFLPAPPTLYIYSIVTLSLAPSYVYNNSNVTLVPSTINNTATVLAPPIVYNNSTATLCLHLPLYIITTL